MNATNFITQHALFWLLAGNGVGLWLALLLVFPDLNSLFGEFTYGRIVPLHLNFQLYGWTSLPLVAWLFRLYPSDRRSDDRVARGAALAWSISLGLGGTSWLMGLNSGKIFLEWQGFSRILFTFALLFLWCALAARFWVGYRQFSRWMMLRVFGLIALAAVVPLWYWASSSSVYPAVNPHTSGPTAASLLGSTLAVILILLLAGRVLGEPRSGARVRAVCWVAFLFEVAMFLGADKGDRSHRSAGQVTILGSLLVWIPLLPAYFRSFEFPTGRRDHQYAFLGWFALLAATGWLSFLPKILDAWKFTNALVAHSHLAMAGFVTCFNIFLLGLLNGAKSAAIFSRRSFAAWNLSAFTFILLLWTAGTFEAHDPGFTIVPSVTRSIIYSGRLLCGAAMLICSALWWSASLRASLSPDRSAASWTAIQGHEILVSI